MRERRLPARSSGLSTGGGSVRDSSEQQATFNLDRELLAGEIRSRTAVRLIREWASLHRAQIEANWAKMKAGEPLEKIEPLE